MTPEPLVGCGRANPEAVVAAPALNTLEQPQPAVGVAELVPISPVSQKKAVTKGAAHGPW